MKSCGFFPLVSIMKNHYIQNNISCQNLISIENNYTIRLHHKLNGFRNFDTECKDGADTLKLNFILGDAPFIFLCHSTLHFLQ